MSAIEEIKKLTEEVKKLREAVERQNSLPHYVPVPYMPQPAWPHNPLWPTVTYGTNTPQVKC